MKSAIYNGLLSSDMTSRANPPSSCPSGNCTWDPFPTLAISASCSNTPDSFEIHCSPFTEEDPLWDNIKGIDDAVRPQNCTVAKVLGSERKGVRNRVEPISSNTIGTQPVFWIYSKYADTTDDLDASDWNTMPTGGIVLIEWARLKNLYRPPGQGLYFINQTSTIEASSCHLYTSVQEIRAWVDDGVYGETVIREISNATTEVFAEPGNNNLKENVTASGSTLLRNYKYEYAKSRNFTISHVHQQVLLQGVEVVVGSNAWLKVEDNGFLHAENFVLDRDRDTRVQSVTVTKALYQTPNITNAVLSLARHMTVALRSNDTITDSQFRNSGFEEYVAPSHRVNGTVYRDQIHVEIRWDWLTFPAALLILVFVLLGTTIIETWSEEVGVWKDSPLALLLHSQWETGPERKPTGARTALDIAEEVKGLNAFFVRGGTGEDLGRKSIKRRIFISRDRPEGNE